MECHSFHEPTIVKTTVGAVDLAVAGDQDQGHCRSCHNEQGRLADLSGAHQTAANLYHEEAGELQNVSPSAACLRCHSQASVSPWQAATAGQTLTFNTHASHPYSVKVVPGQGDKNNWIAYQIDARLPLFAGKMECQTCHLLTAGQKDLLIPFETKYDLCRGCHKHTGDSKLEARPVLTSLSNR